jgi:iron complex outermembrane receptor protein
LDDTMKTPPGIVLPFLAFLLLASLARAAGVSVTGTIKSPDGSPAKDTRVLLVEMNRSGFVEDDGSFRFDDVPAGRYHLQAINRRFGTHVEEFSVGGSDVELEIELGHMSHQETIIVTAGARRGGAEITHPVNVMDKNDLTEAMQPTIGETLKSEPGVNSTYYGPGSSRPVIRGQGAGRIRILEGGLDVGDASSTSPDHAVASDPLSAESVEILRGPATLLYGSTAVGGVVNVLDERVPDHVPSKPIGGTVELSGGTVAEEGSGAVEFRGGGGQLAWYASAFTRETDDYDIPGNAVVGDPDSSSGTLPNSALESGGGTLGGSWVGKNGYVGLSARAFESTYGVPVELEGGIEIDVEHRRYDLRGGFDTDLGPFDGIDFSAGVTDYEHREIESGEIGTEFFNDTIDGRVELRQGATGPLRGVVGLQFGSRDLEAMGEEVFVPASRTDAVAVFAVEEIESGPLVYELGLRLETQDVSADDNPDRDFDGLSASFGLFWRASDVYGVGVSVARTERFPRAEELYSDGPHLATFSYEIGDPDLGEETSLGLDLSLRKREGRVTGELNLFGNRYDDYVYEDPTGDTRVVDALQLPELLFTQADAEFLGAELNVLVELLETEAGHLGLELTSDYVRAELRDDGEPLPFIPPLRTGLALHYRAARWHGSVGFWYYDEQDRVPDPPEFESTPPPEVPGLLGLTPTDDYTMLDAHVGYRLPTGGMMHEFLLRGTNLTNEEAHNSVSRLKDLVPLPGRDLRLVYRLIF